MDEDLRHGAIAEAPGVSYFELELQGLQSEAPAFGLHIQIQHYSKAIFLDVCTRSLYVLTYDPRKL